jgi:DNA-binding beta-propeller fold protein YncE
MKKILTTLVCSFPLLMVFAWVMPTRAAEGPFKLIKEISIGGEGGWDYLSVDTAAKRLYVTHATKVVVIDVASNEVVGEIADTPGVHGFALAPDLGRGFPSNGRESKAGIVDLKSLLTSVKVETGQNPDAILYEPTHKDVYVFNGRGKSATVFDATSGAVTATIPLPGKPEFAVVDIKAGRIYNNIEDTSSVVVIDTATHTLVATWPIAPGEEASGLAIDLVNHRLFVGCSNSMMVMMDSTTGKVLSTIPIGPGVDANAFDPGLGYAFASSSDGTLTVASVNTSGKLTLVQTLATPPRSRTMTLDPTTHRLYVSAADFKPGVAGPDGKPGRPQIIPGSFRVMVYGPSTSR